MKFDSFGELVISSDELVDELYRQPTLNIGNFSVTNPESYNHAVQKLHVDYPLLKRYLPLDYKEEVPLELFDNLKQSNWFMPTEYLELDIAQHILNLCNTEAELQRVGEELLLYQERDLFNLLRYLKYFVDTMRANNIVWGLGRGSSTASYILYLLGVHKINSLYYDLPIEEFLK
ncbi:Bacterial DNA polymerase III, alpha subunit [uncultured Caudovirales phage]|uniref:Bacterial DNA polymerase III, alpha subunit n=1 Tax=uncultured Caudovirales phage TaxID=2100421 RepID=A0A6J5L7J6_9CAUD|nr:Bacterial DNA polymerase III, alpha subunit [uncultured Caudovirales phage]